MKKLLFLMSALALTVFAGCEKEPVQHIGQEGKEITITAAIDLGDTKITYDDVTLKTEWELGDQLWALGFDAQEQYLGKTLFTAFKKDEFGKTHFKGNVIEGAETYDFVYVNETVNVAEDGTINWENFACASTDGKTPELGNLIPFVAHRSTPELQHYIVLAPECAIIRFDIESYPEEIGQVKSIQWRNNLYSFTECSMACQFEQVPAEGQPLKVWFFVKENSMNLQRKETIAVDFKGTKTDMRVKAISENGKNYYKKNRYYIPVSKEQKPGTLCDWESLDNILKKTTLRVKTVDNQKPASYDNWTLSESMDAEGYWNYVYNNGPFSAFPGWTFRYDKTFVEIELPEGTTTTQPFAFNDCPALKKVTLPASMRKIGTNCFQDDNALAEIIGLDHVEELEDWGFGGCSSLNVNIPSGLKIAGNYAFYGCGIASSEIPVFDHLGDGAFRAAIFKQSKISVAEGTTAIPYICFYEAVGPDDMTMHIPASVKTIGISALGNSGFKAFTGMEGVEVVSESAFESCGIQAMTIPATVKQVDKGIFTYCTALTDLRFEPGTDCVVHDTAFGWIRSSVNLVLNEAWKGHPDGPQGNSWKGHNFASITYEKM